MTHDKMTGRQVQGKQTQQNTTVTSGFKSDILGSHFTPESDRKVICELSFVIIHVISI